MFIGCAIAVIAFVRIIGFAGYGYTENRDDIAFYVFVSLFGYVMIIFGDTVGKRSISEQGIQDAIRAKARQDLKDKMNQWDKELTAEEMNESYSSNQTN